ncbi:serine protease [Chlorella sorokiniana]|uniref:Serine protease n=1 Tax=Chlorella sorokiniana TaxID=3076 RepID=A0A2P6TLX8_CHLSO|nr:serine protease [Chlorella sorokiniana]|eukprot:PRW45343.1 serine protease [Chlorella sorokiniana]
MAAQRQQQQRQQRRRPQRRRRPLPPALALCLVALAAAALPLAAAGAPAADQDLDEYVVVFKRGFDAGRIRALCSDRATAAGRLAGLCRRRFSAVLNGFAGSLSRDDVAALRQAFGAAIERIERESLLSITGHAEPEWAASDRLPEAARAARGRLLLAEQRRQARRTAAMRRRKLPEQAGPTWTLDRIDQNKLPLDHLYHYDSMGTGVNVYVLDTGIRFTHQEFKTQDGLTVRARHGYSVFGDDDSNDCNGHGTHTAATVGGLTYGVAKNVTLWAVRAMNCDGDAKVSSILEAFEWIAENAQYPAIMSMSVAGEMSTTVNEAARRLVEDRHIVMVVAAGNSYESACLMSPASSPWVISVAASDDQDRRWGQSNWGPCVDVHAPGVQVLSAVSTSDTAIQNKTGTSMATPHVTGVVALYLERHPGASPVEVRQKLNSAAIPDAISDDPDGWGTWNPSSHPQSVDISITPNRLLHSTLTAQALLSPSVVTVGNANATSVSLTLTSQPTADVSISVSVPTAGWANASLATVSPASLTIPAASWNSSQTIQLQPAGALVDGPYFVTLQFQSADPRFNSALQTLRVVDSRPLTGDSATSPRWITSLPFSDSDVTSRFTDKYPAASGGDGGGSPDVLYAYTPKSDVAVEVSTCGSLFDTRLYVFDDPANPQNYVGNDDDPNCTSNGKASRLSTTFQAGVTYYIVVDGYSGGDWLDSQGQYTLTITQSATDAR